MSHEIHAFPDSNVFLHYKPLAQIDWCRLLKVRWVTLVICLPVIQELDNKKSDPRLADRARRAIKEIEEHEAAAKPLRSGVTLEVYNEELRRDEFPSSLSPDSQDDRIVHLVRKYSASHPDRNVCVLTEDYGMVLRCRVGGAIVHRMEASDRLENPGEEKDKKLKQLQSELISLKNRLPKFSVSVCSPGQTQEKAEQFRCTLTNDWAELDAQVEVEKQRRAYHKHSDKITSSFNMPITDLFESRISPERWAKYDSDLDSYFLNYRVYVERLNIWGANGARTIVFIVLVENTGNCLATNIDIFLEFPPKIRWLAERSTKEAGALRKPEPPSPPDRPNPDFIPMSALLRSQRNAVGTIFDELQNVAALKNPDVPEINVVVRPDVGHLIHARMGRLKHGDGVVLGTFLAVLGSWEDVSPFQVKYTISTIEHPERIIGKIPLIVTSASESSDKNDEDDVAGADEPEGH